MFLSDLILGHDTGTAHLAATLNRPNIVIFGPTPPERFLPLSPVSLGIGTIKRNEIIKAFGNLLYKDPNEFGITEGTGDVENPKPEDIMQAAQLILSLSDNELREKVSFSPEAGRVIYLLKEEIGDFLKIPVETFIQRFDSWSRISNNLKRLIDLLPDEFKSLMEKESYDFIAGMNELWSKERNPVLIKTFFQNSNILKMIDILDIISRPAFGENTKLKRKINKSFYGGLFDFDLTIFDEKEGRVRRGIMREIFKTFIQKMVK